MNNEREEEIERKVDVLYTKVKTIFDCHIDKNFSTSYSIILANS